MSCLVRVSTKIGWYDLTACLVVVSAVDAEAGGPAAPWASVPPATTPFLLFFLRRTASVSAAVGEGEERIWGCACAWPVLRQNMAPPERANDDRGAMVTALLLVCGRPRETKPRRRMGQAGVDQCGNPLLLKKFGPKIYADLKINAYFCPMRASLKRVIRMDIHIHAKPSSALE